MYTENIVRKELREIARRQASIAALIRTKDHLTAQAQCMGDMGKEPTEAVNTLASAKNAITRLIDEAVEANAKYIDSVSALPSLYRTIILEHYFNGTVMWKVAELVGYSERQAKEYLRLAVKELTAILNA